MKAYLVVTGTLFGGIALLHLSRLFTHWPSAVIAGWEVPTWLSALGLPVAGAMCLWAVSLSRGLRRPT